MRCVTAVEPLRHRARQLRLPAGEHLAHGVHAPGRLGLDAGDFRHALFEFAGMDVVARRLPPRAREARASMMAIAPSRASTTQAKAASASPTVTATPPMIRKVSVMDALYAIRG